MTRRRGAARSTPADGLVGQSAAIETLRGEIEAFAAVEAPVLLLGETGTGKELVAQGIHAASRRHRGPFVSVNLGAIPPSLAASELFGAARGAFTGAVQAQDGFFRKAQGGTLFLDEIGETPQEVQASLLRVLEAGEIQPVGAQSALRVDVRVLAATDADLEQRVQAGTFREPLLHRLAGYSIRLPPLRERRDDVGRLLVHFLRQELAATGELDILDRDSPHLLWIKPALVVRLARYDWPGNVRQLRNNIERLMILVGGDADSLITADMLPDEIISPVPLSPNGAGGEHLMSLPLRDAREIFEREYLLAQVNRFGGNISRTAEFVGMERSALHRKLRALGVNSTERGAALR
jgi:two-component system nitrogen regulation response regulator NtrX